MRISATLRRAALAVLTISLLLGGTARAESQEVTDEAGLGAAAALATLVYGPTKLAWATMGTVVSGLAFALTGGDGTVAKPILTSAVRGDYVVTPSHLTGRRALEFIGREPEDRPDGYW